MKDRIYINLAPYKTMRQSPWRAYFGQMQNKSSKQGGDVPRHPVVVALSVISVICLIAAALALRFNKWYFGKLSVKPICNDPGYKLPRVHTVVPIYDWVAYLIAFLGPPIIVLLIELIILVVALDKSEPEHSDDSKSRPLKGSTLFMFRFLHFIAAHLLTLAFVSVLVDLAKIVFDWHRPYFLREFASLCEGENDPDRSISREEILARLGFPSHRVALLSAAAVLLSVHVVRSLRGLRSSGPFQTLIIMASVIPLIFASASVINSHDNKSADVVIGMLMGAISAAYMSSMLPSAEVTANADETPGRADSSSSPNIPATIEELNSVVPMRQAQAVSWQIRRSPLVKQQASNRNTVPGYTTRG